MKRAVSVLFGLEDPSLSLTERRVVIDDAPSVQYDIELLPLLVVLLELEEEALARLPLRGLAHTRRSKREAAQRRARRRDERPTRHL